MDPQQIDDAFVVQASRVVGIELTAEQLPGVVDHLRRTAEAAQLVNGIPLGTEDELGPIWRP
jgi:hypothetical protein